MTGEGSRSRQFRDALSTLVHSNSPRTRPIRESTGDTIIATSSSKSTSPGPEEISPMLLTPPPTQHISNFPLPPPASDTPIYTPLPSPLIFYNSPHITASFPLETDPQASTIPYHIYRRHLSTKGRGTPLWIPEPNENLHIEYRREGLSIGDVIKLTPYGGFDLLFNIRHPAEHPFNMGSVPEGFSPLDPLLNEHDIHSYEELGENSCLTSGSVTEDTNRLGPSGIHFQSSAGEGAILALPNGALSQELTNTASFERYTAENIEKWYKHAKGSKGWKIRNGDLHVVIGVDKASAWGMATFAAHTPGRDVQLQFRTINDPEGGPKHRWEYDGLVGGTPRTGPSERQIAALAPVDAEPGPSERRQMYRNQCLFVRTLNMQLQQDRWEAIQVEGISLGVPDAPTQGDQDGKLGSSAIASISGRSRSGFGLGGSSLLSAQGTTQCGNYSGSSDLHPSAAINRFLLEKYPEAKLAISKDSEWISVLRPTDDTLPSEEEILHRLQATHIAVDNDGIAGWKARESEIAPSGVNEFALSGTIPSRFPSVYPLRIKSRTLEDLPVYIPRIERKSKSAAFHSLSVESPPPVYGTSPRSPRSKSEDNVLVESPKMVGAVPEGRGIATLKMPAKKLSAGRRSKSAGRTDKELSKSLHGNMPIL